MKKVLSLVLSLCLFVSLGAGISFEKVDAEEMAELTKSLGITQAPTLVVRNGDAQEVLSGIGSITEYINRN